MNGCIYSPYKVLYYSRQQAISGAVRAWKEFGDPMVPYLCSEHWHVAHSRNPDAQRERVKALGEADRRGRPRVRERRGKRD